MTVGLAQEKVSSTEEPCEAVCMVCLYSLLSALSTYTVIPMPQLEWSEYHTRLAICFFPVAGVICGGGLIAWTVLCQGLNCSPFCAAVVGVCVPLLITGGIHMDGYMDTVDALASHQSTARRLEIMKDPNCGAFAVIYCGIALLVETGLYYELYVAGWLASVCPMFVLSRSLGAWSAVTMPSARSNGMLGTFTRYINRSSAAAAMAIIALLSCAGMILLAPVVGCGAVVGGIISFLVYRRTAMRLFGGITGDTTGFFIQICELSCLLGGWIGLLVFNLKTT